MNACTDSLFLIYCLYLVVISILLFQSPLYSFVVIHTGTHLFISNININPGNIPSQNSDNLW